VTLKDRVKSEDWPKLRLLWLINAKKRVGIANPVINSNVGKTPLARHLFARKLGTEVFSVESLNADGDENNIIKGKDFLVLQDELLKSENMVIDVGASNVEDFLSMMKKFEGANEDIDLFVVPVVPARKQQTDTIGTLIELLELDIPKSSLRVVLNQAAEEDDYQKIFRPIIDFCDENDVSYSKSVVVENELYDMLKNSDDTIDNLLEDKTDYKAAIADSDDAGEKQMFARKIAKKRLAKGVGKQLDKVYESVVA